MCRTSEFRPRFITPSSIFTSDSELYHSTVGTHIRPRAKPWTTDPESLFHAYTPRHGPIHWIQAPSLNAYSTMNSHITDQTLNLYSPPPYLFWIHAQQPQWILTSESDPEPDSADDDRYSLDFGMVPLQCLQSITFCFSGSRPFAVNQFEVYLVSKGLIPEKHTNSAMH